jgi:hypothetical protein
MNEHHFLEAIQAKATELGINPLLLLSGIEGVYTFRDVELNGINYEFLDSLILTIFALRIGDTFHSLAEENLASGNESVRRAAHFELQPLSDADIQQSSNSYLQSFAKLLNGKSVVRNYHQKALEARHLRSSAARCGFSTKASAPSWCISACTTWKAP